MKSRCAILGTVVKSQSEIEKTKGGEGMPSTTAPTTTLLKVLDGTIMEVVDEGDELKIVSIKASEGLRAKLLPFVATEVGTAHHRAVEVAHNLYGSDRDGTHDVINLLESDAARLLLERQVIDRMLVPRLRLSNIQLGKPMRPRSGEHFRMMFVDDDGNTSLLYMGYTQL